MGNQLKELPKLLFNYCGYLYPTPSPKEEKLNQSMTSPPV
jgi:hypothetical protein